MTGGATDKRSPRSLSVASVCVSSALARPQNRPYQRHLPENEETRWSAPPVDFLQRAAAAVLHLYHAQRPILQVPPARIAVCAAVTAVQHRVASVAPILHNVHPQRPGENVAARRAADPTARERGGGATPAAPTARESRPDPPPVGMREPGGQGLGGAAFTTLSPEAGNQRSEASGCHGQRSSAVRQDGVGRGTRNSGHDMPLRPTPLSSRKEDA